MVTTLLASVAFENGRPAIAAHNLENGNVLITIVGDTDSRTIELSKQMASYFLRTAAQGITDV
jgi:hypothetical protein